MENQIELFLFVIIIVLFLIDIFLQVKRSSSLDYKFSKITLSKYSFIIILLAIGISTISICFQLGWKYLVSGDPWDVIKYANHTEIQIKAQIILIIIQIFGVISLLV